ncbi:MAG: hypothetical protein V7754_12335 [Halioglobus sp.]
MNTHSFNRRPAATVALALALLTAAATCQAQTATESPPPAPAPDVENEQQQDKPSTAPKAGTEDERSPFDYRSSEEISEDLSVSYPVDI